MIKLIKFWPQYKAEQYIFKANEAVISITDPDEGDVKIHGADNILRLKFLDVENTDTQNIKKELCFQDSHARAIFLFVNRLIEDNEIDTIIVHCKMGVSRSAAVALILEAYTGAELYNRDMSGFANKEVMHNLFITFGLKDDIIMPDVNYSSLMVYDL